MEITTEIIALERAALDRWGRGDPQGCLKTYADDITYFDPVAPTRIDGLDAMKAWYAPIAGKVRIARYDIVLARWNTTAVYRQADAGWKIAHSHFSYTQPVVSSEPRA